MQSQRLIAAGAFLALTLFSTTPLWAEGGFGGLFGGGGGQSGWGGNNGNKNSGLEKAIVGGIFGAIEQGIKASAQNGHHDDDHGHHGNHNNHSNHGHQHGNHYYPQWSSNNYEPQYYYPKPVPVTPAAPKYVEPPKNKAPVKIVSVKKNSVLNQSNIRGLALADIDRANDKLQDQQEEELDHIEEDLAGALPPNNTDLIQQLKNAGIEDPAIVRQILDAKDRGDSATVQILYGSHAKSGYEGEVIELANKINLQNELNDLRDKNQAGDLREKDIDRFAGKVKNVFPPGNARDDLLAHFDDMITTAVVQELLASAIPNPGMGGLNGSVVTVIHNPNLPQGTIINLGNGSMMVGTGGLGDLNISSSTLAGAMGLPVAHSLPVPESDSKTPTTGVVLRNASANGAEIAYVINDKYDYTMKSGHVQSLGEGKWIISYDRGDSYGEARYTLRDGTFEFTAGENGWALVAKKYDVEIDNSGNPNEFHYVINNVAAVVEPYGVKTHQSNYALEVRFDRGDGKGEERKVLHGGAFQVAVSPNDNLWDLYSTDGVPTLADDISGGINLFGN